MKSASCFVPRDKGRDFGEVTRYYAIRLMMLSIKLVMAKLKRNREIERYLIDNVVESRQMLSDYIIFVDNIKSGKLRLLAEEIRLNCSTINEALCRMRSAIPYTPLEDHARDIMDILLKLILREDLSNGEEEEIKRFADCVIGATYV